MIPSVVLVAFLASAATERNPLHPVRMQREWAKLNQSVDETLARVERQNRGFAEADARMAKQKADWEARMRKFDERERRLDELDRLREAQERAKVAPPVKKL